MSDSFHMELIYGQHDFYYDFYHSANGIGDEKYWIGPATVDLKD